MLVDFNELMMVLFMVLAAFFRDAVYAWLI